MAGSRQDQSLYSKDYAGVADQDWYWTFFCEVASAETNTPAELRNLILFGNTVGQTPLSKTEWGISYPLSNLKSYLESKGIPVAESAMQAEGLLNYYLEKICEVSPEDATADHYRILAVALNFNTNARSAISADRLDETGAGLASMENARSTEITAKDSRLPLSSVPLYSENLGEVYLQRSLQDQGVDINHIGIDAAVSAAINERHHSALSAVVAIDKDRAVNLFDIALWVESKPAAEIQAYLKIVDEVHRQNLQGSDFDLNDFIAALAATEAEGNNLKTASQLIARSAGIESNGLQDALYNHLLPLLSDPAPRSHVEQLAQILTSGQFTTLKKQYADLQHLADNFGLSGEQVLAIYSHDESTSDGKLAIQRAVFIQLLRGEIEFPDGQPAAEYIDFVMKYSGDLAEPVAGSYHQAVLQHMQAKLPVLQATAAFAVENPVFDNTTVLPFVNAFKRAGASADYAGLLEMALLLNEESPTAPILQELVRLDAFDDIANDLDPANSIDTLRYQARLYAAVKTQLSTDNSNFQIAHLIKGLPESEQLDAFELVKDVVNHTSGKHDIDIEPSNAANIRALVLAYKIGLVYSVEQVNELFSDQGPFSTLDDSGSSAEQAVACIQELHRHENYKNLLSLGRVALDEGANPVSAMSLSEASSADGSLTLQSIINAVSREAFPWSESDDPRELRKTAVINLLRSKISVSSTEQQQCENALLWLSNDNNKVEFAKSLEVIASLPLEFLDAQSTQNLDQFLTKFNRTNADLFSGQTGELSSEEMKDLLPRHCEGISHAALNHPNFMQYMHERRYGMGSSNPQFFRGDERQSKLQNAITLALKLREPVASRAFAIASNLYLDYRNAFEDEGHLDATVFSQARNACRHTEQALAGIDEPTQAQFKVEIIKAVLKAKGQAELASNENLVGQLVAQLLPGSERIRDVRFAIRSVVSKVAGVANQELWQQVRHVSIVADNFDSAFTRAIKGVLNIRSERISPSNAKVIVDAFLPEVKRLAGDEEPTLFHYQSAFLSLLYPDNQIIAAREAIRAMPGGLGLNSPAFRQWRVQYAMAHAEGDEQAVRLAGIHEAARQIMASEGVSQVAAAQVLQVLSDPTHPATTFIDSRLQNAAAEPTIEAYAAELIDPDSNVATFVDDIKVSADAYFAMSDDALPALQTAYVLFKVIESYLPEQGELPAGISREKLAAQLSSWFLSQESEEVISRADPLQFVAEQFEAYGAIVGLVNDCLESEVSCDDPLIYAIAVTQDRLKPAADSAAMRKAIVQAKAEAFALNGVNSHQEIVAGAQNLRAHEPMLRPGELVASAVEIPAADSDESLTDANRLTQLQALVASDEVGNGFEMIPAAFQATSAIAAHPIERNMILMTAYLNAGEELTQFKAILKDTIGSEPSDSYVTALLEYLVLKNPNLDLAQAGQLQQAIFAADIEFEQQQPQLVDHHAYLAGFTRADYEQLKDGRTDTYGVPSNPLSRYAHGEDPGVQHGITVIRAEAVQQAFMQMALSLNLDDQSQALLRPHVSLLPVDANTTKAWITASTDQRKAQLQTFVEQTLYQPSAEQWPLRALRVKQTQAFAGHRFYQPSGSEWTRDGENQARAETLNAIMRQWPEPGIGSDAESVSIDGVDRVAVAVQDLLVSYQVPPHLQANLKSQIEQALEGVTAQLDSNAALCQFISQHIEQHQARLDAVLNGLNSKMVDGERQRLTANDFMSDTQEGLQEQRIEALRGSLIAHVIHQARLAWKSANGPMPLADIQQAAERQVAALNLTAEHLYLDTAIQTFVVGDTLSISQQPIERLVDDSAFTNTASSFFDGIDPMPGRRVLDKLRAQKWGDQHFASASEQVRKDMLDMGLFEVATPGYQTYLPYLLNTLDMAFDARLVAADSQNFISGNDGTLRQAIDQAYKERFDKVQQLSWANTYANMLQSFGVAEADIDAVLARLPLPDERATTLPQRVEAVMKHYPVLQHEGFLSQTFAGLVGLETKEDLLKALQRQFANHPRLAGMKEGLRRVVALAVVSRLAAAKNWPEGNEVEMDQLKAFARTALSTNEYSDWIMRSAFATQAMANQIEAHELSKPYGTTGGVRRRLNPDELFSGEVFQKQVAAKLMANGSNPLVHKLTVRSVKAGEPHAVEVHKVGDFGRPYRYALDVSDLAFDAQEYSEESPEEAANTFSAQATEAASPLKNRIEALHARLRKGLTPEQSAELMVGLEVVLSDHLYYGVNKEELGDGRAEFNKAIELVMALRGGHKGLHKAANHLTKLAHSGKPTADLIAIGKVFAPVIEEQVIPSVMKPFGAGVKTATELGQQVDIMATNMGMDIGDVKGSDKRVQFKTQSGAEFRITKTDNLPSIAIKTQKRMSHADSKLLKRMLPPGTTVEISAKTRSGIINMTMIAMRNHNRLDPACLDQMKAKNPDLYGAVISACKTEMVRAEGKDGVLPEKAKQRVVQLLGSHAGEVGLEVPAALKTVTPPAGPNPLPGAGPQPGPRLAPVPRAQPGPNPLPAPVNYYGLNLQPPAGEIPTGLPFMQAAETGGSQSGSDQPNIPDPD